MDDIVTRLRHAEENGICEWQVLIEAADEIERLVQERNRWQATAAGITQDLSNCEDKFEELKEEINTLKKINQSLHLDLMIAYSENIGLYDEYNQNNQ